MKTHTIHLPFAQLRLLRSEARHRHFFDDYFFHSSQHTPHTFFTIKVDFNELEIPGDSPQLEHRFFYDQGHFYVTDPQGQSAIIDFELYTKNTVSVTVDPNFDLYYLITFLLEPLYIIALTHNQVSVVHASSSADHNNKGSVFIAWRNTGKTHTMLELTSRGNSFLADDYCVIFKQCIYSYPKKINLFSYNFVAFPTLFSALSLGVVVKIRLSLATTASLHWLARHSTGTLARVWTRLAELSQTFSNIKLAPQQLGITTPDQVTLQNTYLLVRNGNKYPKADKDDLLRQVQTIILYELSDFFAIYAAYKFLTVTKHNSLIDTFAQSYYATARQNLGYIHVIPHDHTESLTSKF